MRTTKLLVADDAAIVRTAVARVVADCCDGVELVGEVKDYGELFRALGLVKADVVLMDLNMPAESPVEPEVLKAQLGPACLLAMSAWFDESTKVRARAYGAWELLDKPSLALTLGPAIDRCMRRICKATGQ